MKIFTGSIRKQSYDDTRSSHCGPCVVESEEMVLEVADKGIVSLKGTRDSHIFSRILRKPTAPALPRYRDRRGSCACAVKKVGGRTPGFQRIRISMPMAGSQGGSKVYRHPANTGLFVPATGPATADAGNR
jgi:hypothetical protein